MKYENLIDFLENYLPKKMQHIYLPLIISNLADSGGFLTLRQIAQEILLKDESQLQYYEKRAKDMPLKVLKKHGIINKDGNLISLTTGKLTFEQVSKIKILCEKSLNEFVEKRGLGIWDYRMLET